MTVEHESQRSSRPEDVQYPVLKESVKIPFRAPLPPQAGFLLPDQYKIEGDHGYYIARYIIGEDYRGPVLPENTREVLHILVVANDGKERVQKQLIAYADATNPDHSLWDRVVGYDESGYSIWQENGNIGRMVIQGSKARTWTKEDRRKPWDLDELDKSINKTSALRVGGLPHYQFFVINELPSQDVNPTYLDGILGINKEFTPISVEDLDR